MAHGGEREAGPGDGEGADRHGLQLAAELPKLEIPSPTVGAQAAGAPLLPDPAFPHCHRAVPVMHRELLSDSRV